MGILSQKTASHRALAITLVGVLAFAATASMAVGMRADEHGAMSECPFMSAQAVVCPMGVLEHITKWQQSFTAAFSPSNILSFLLFLFLGFFLAFYIRASYASTPIPARSPPVVNRERKVGLLNHLVAAFSQGILHPKIYTVLAVR